jgi:transposase
VHGVDAAGQVVVRRQLKRRQVLGFFAKLPPCLIGIEACASSHYWSRELQALGHTVRLMPPAYVKPYVKRQKNDAADAEAICEAVTRPNMRFVPTKTVEQQDCMVLHRTRHLFIRQQTAVINSIRAYLAEFGVVAPVGRRGVEQLLAVIADSDDARVPEVARACVAALRQLKAQILELDRRILAWHRSSETSRRLKQIPGVGPVLATAPVAQEACRKGRGINCEVVNIDQFCPVELLKLHAQLRTGEKRDVAVSSTRSLLQSRDRRRHVRSVRQGFSIPLGVDEWQRRCQEDAGADNSPTR